MTDLYNAHVDLYDIAFGWDISEEVEWLLDRLGHDCRKVLEPGCGTGRMLEAFARHGVEAVGIDSSRAMVLFAERRLREGRLPARVVLGDMRDFDLGETFKAAVCPIGTLAQLAPDELTAHLDCMARHLAPGASYLVQLALRDAHSADEALTAETWEMSRGGTALQITWATEEIDLERMLERQRSRIEVLEGDRAGEVFEEVHTVALWTPETWSTEVARSAFRLACSYDGEQPERPRVEAREVGRLLWHQLTRGTRPERENPPKRAPSLLIT